MREEVVREQEKEGSRVGEREEWGRWEVVQNRKRRMGEMGGRTK